MLHASELSEWLCVVFFLQINRIGDQFIIVFYFDSHRDLQHNVVEYTIGKTFLDNCRHPHHCRACDSHLSTMRFYFGDDDVAHPFLVSEWLQFMHIK